MNFNLILYKKLLNFSFFYFKIKNNFINKDRSFTFLKIIKFLFNVNNFNIFVDENLTINNKIFISYWINGLITNFSMYKFHLAKKLNMKILSNIIINLTDNYIINIEIQKKKLPLIYLNRLNDNMQFDYYIKDNHNISNNTLDNTFFFILLFKIFKKYKDV